MGFYFFGSVLFVFAILLATVGVLSSRTRPTLGVYIIYVSAIVSLPGFLVIWDFALYGIIRLFPWS